MVADSLVKLRCLDYNAGPTSDEPEEGAPKTVIRMPKLQGIHFSMLLGLMR
jgi:hypothetical protein